MANEHVQTKYPTPKSITGLKAVFPKTNHCYTVAIFAGPLSAFFGGRSGMKPKDMTFVVEGKRNELICMTLKSHMQDM